MDHLLLPMMPFIRSASHENAHLDNRQERVLLSYFLLDDSTAQIDYNVYER